MVFQLSTGRTPGGHSGYSPPLRNLDAGILQGLLTRLKRTLPKTPLALSRGRAKDLYGTELPDSWNRQR
jgi:hypothetical protein